MNPQTTRIPRASSMLTLAQSAYLAKHSASPFSESEGAALPGVDVSHLPENPRYVLKPYGTKGQWGVIDRLLFKWESVWPTKSEAETIWCGLRSTHMPPAKAKEAGK